MSSTEPAVIIEKSGHIATLRLNRPDNRNSMTPELLDAFAARVAELRSDEDLRCVVVTGTGSCFSAGADFRAAVQREGHGRTTGERSYAMYAPFLSLIDVEVPVIGALQGHAVGGGFGLSLCCDLRVACSTARYGANFAKLGISAGLAISDVLPRLIGVPRAMELLMTGQLISGDQGAAWGLFNAAVPAEQVLARALELADDIARSAPIAVRLMKRSIYQNLGWDPRAAAWREAFAQATTLQTDDAREGIDALLAKRPPQFRGR
ncbi:MAG: enoyl-CoA hydratase/isomerase family protein [Deltaproteobacteria bacterium]|nr:enoyl-CoA hydratase/isomerase family protein [Deltaproteobacteria bacterium]